MATGGGAPALLDDDGEMFRVFFSVPVAAAANPIPVESGETAASQFHGLMLQPADAKGWPGSQA